MDTFVSINTTRFDFEWKNQTIEMCQRYLTMIGSIVCDITEDALEPLGKRIVLTHYLDASLMHDILSGKTVTSV